MGIGVWTLAAVETGGVPFTDSSHTNQIVYDPLFDLVLLYGNGGFTYQWDGTSWTQLATTPNVGIPMVWFDENNGTPMMYGGSATNAALNETYSWDWGSAVWNLQAPSVKPPKRQQAGIAFDSGHSNAIMFGGLSGGIIAAFATSDTYRWNGANWSLRSPATVPTARFGNSMAYDPIRDEIIMFGGRSVSNVILDDTWAWSGAGTPNWTAKSPATVPPERENHGMAWDPFLEKVVMYGGSSIGDAYLDDTWAWDGTDWEDLTGTVGVAQETYLLGLCYYTTRDELTMLTCRFPGGIIIQGDTWVLHHTVDRSKKQMIRWR